MSMERQRAIEQIIRGDRFAVHLGAVIEAIEPGYARASLTVGAEMLNMHGTTHGGVIQTLADVVFAAASNSHGQTSVALDITTSFLRATHAGDRLVAEAREVHTTHRTGLYEITVTLAETGQPVARSQATVYRRDHWFVPPEGQGSAS
mgnify:CR=1 FL=1